MIFWDINPEDKAQLSFFSLCMYVILVNPGGVQKNYLKLGNAGLNMQKGISINRLHY